MPEEYNIPKKNTDVDLVAKKRKEFVCQGLELNIPIVYLGEGLLFINGQRHTNPTKQYEDKETTVRNIFRVLLSRGRIRLIL